SVPGAWHRGTATRWPHRLRGVPLCGICISLSRSLLANLTISEGRAVSDPEHEIDKTVVVRRRFTYDSANLRLIPAANRTTECVRHQLGYRGSHEHICLRQHRLLESVWSFEFLSVRQHAAGVDRAAFVLETPAPQHVEIFQGEPPRVDTRVASRANRICPMALDLLARCQYTAIFCRLDVEGRHTGRRRRRRCIQEAAQDPDTS